VLWHFVPESRRGRVVLALALSLALAGFCDWYKPWQAHFRGRPSSYWAEVLADAERNRFDRAGTNQPPPPFWRWLSRLIGYPGLPPSFADDDAFARVLEDLVKHPDQEVRLAAAFHLCRHGDKGFRRSAPVLIDGLLRDQSVERQVRICQILGARAQFDPQPIKTVVDSAAVPELIEVLGDLLNEEVMNYDDVIHLLAAISPQHADWAGESSWKKNTWRNAMSYYQFPHGWTVVHSGAGARGSWNQVRPPPREYFFDSVAQVGQSPPGVTELCVAQQPTVKDVKLRVEFHAVAGVTCRGGGVVWRYFDADNYCAAGADLLSGSLEIFAVVAGRRTRLAYANACDLSDRRWHELTVRQVGNRIECFLDGAKYLEVTDETVAAAGKVGLWTSADAQTRFKRLRVTNLER
jgi:hypothetical protein